MNYSMLQACKEKKKVFIAFLKYYFAQKKTEQSENLKRQSYCTYWMTLKLYANSWIIWESLRYSTNLPFSQTDHFPVLQFEI